MWAYMFSTAYVIAATILSLLGVVLFYLGKRNSNLSIGISGILLIVLPCIVFKPLALWAVSLASVVLCLAVGKVSKMMSGSSASAQV